MADAVPHVMEVAYTNYRGEKSIRRITPHSVRYGSTTWHVDQQWLLKAWDHHKMAVREFALKDCDFVNIGEPEED